MKNLLKLFATALVCFVLATAINIPLHEAGHYVVAESYGKSPSFHFLEKEKVVNENGVQTTAIVPAYVSYFSETSENTSEDATIAFAGPFVNLMLGLLGIGLFFRVRKKNLLAEVAVIVFIIVSFVAFASNLLPVIGSDGAVILSVIG